MSILLIPGKFNPDPWVKALQAQEPSLEIEVWPRVKHPEKVEFAIVWRYPQGELKYYPNLRAIQSLGAGVDHILQDQERPDLPVARIVDPFLIRDMTQYIVMMVLHYARHMDFYLSAQKNAAWLPQPQPDKRVGILGLGKLGTDTAEKLLSLGFTVNSWSRSHKKLYGVKSYAGQQQLDDFLSHSDILVCLLPLTEETKGILDLKLFKKLPAGSYLINVARGGHLVEQDLLMALEQGILAGACLDVFEVEPLSREHPFWSHPKIIITPHIASVTRPDTAAIQLLENYRRAISGRPLLNQVDIKRGY